MSRLNSTAAVLVLISPLVLGVGPATADGMISPNPSLAPRQVVEIQLNALQHNNDPHKDAGIERTWAFAHPYNKRITGLLRRFEAMIKGPDYRMLVGHRTHAVQRIAATDDFALFAVTVIPAAGPVVSYQWKLEKVRSGPFSGDWMTLAVSPPIRRGDSI